MFSCEFCDISKNTSEWLILLRTNTFLTSHFQTMASSDTLLDFQKRKKLNVAIMYISRISVIYVIQWFLWNLIPFINCFWVLIFSKAGKVIKYFLHVIKSWEGHWRLNLNWLLGYTVYLNKIDFWRYFHGFWKEKGVGKSSKTCLNEIFPP